MLELLEGGGSFLEMTQIHYERFLHECDEECEDGCVLDEDEDEDEDEDADDSDEDTDEDGDNNEEDETSADDEDDDGFDFNIDELADRQFDGYVNMVTDEFEDEEAHELIEYIAGLEFGVPSIFQGETADWIVMRLDVLENEAVFESYRRRIVIDLKLEGFNDMIDTLAQEKIDSGVIVINTAARDRYSPRKFIAM